MKWGAALLLFFSISANAQNKLTVTGSIQSDMLVPSEAIESGGKVINNDFLTNTYAEAAVLSKHVDGGLRLEYMDYPLPGYDKDFAGWGLANIYAKVHYDKWDVTVGNFYEQFGSGFILRAYEERSLGIDNSLLGARATVRPVKGVSVKALAGTQRRYWSYNDDYVGGADVELEFGEWIKSMNEKGTYLTFGASMVTKHEGDEVKVLDKDPAHRFNFPKSVNAFDVRARLQSGGLSLLAEYAMKGQDPNSDNGFIYRNGNVAMLSASYSKKGMSALLQAKRSDNMSFRSKRNINKLLYPSSSTINHLPAFTMEHTYALAALYPYATNTDGEWAYQGEFSYKFKKGTPLGGKYGTGVKVNASYIRAINVDSLYRAGDVKNGVEGTDGYSSKFFKWGKDTYYHDINVQVDKKLSRQFNLHLMYMNQLYNKTVVEGHGGMVHSNIFVADGKYQFAKKTTLRCELQYLNTADDDGDWAYALAELSLAPRWMFTVADMWNCGVTDEHYLQGLVTYNHGAHRVQAGYAHTRKGYNCTGGVCRTVPESKGFVVSYNYNF